MDNNFNQLNPPQMRPGFHKHHQFGSVPPPPMYPPSFMQKQQNVTYNQNSPMRAPTIAGQNSYPSSLPGQWYPEGQQFQRSQPQSSVQMHHSQDQGSQPHFRPQGMGTFQTQNMDSNTYCSSSCSLTDVNDVMHETAKFNALNSASQMYVYNQASNQDIRHGQPNAATAQHTGKDPSTEMNDQQWVNQWLRSRVNRKSKASKPSEECTPVDLPSVQAQLKEFLQLLEEMKLQQAILESNMTDEGFPWQQEYEKIMMTKHQLEELRQQLILETHTEQVMEKIVKTHKKRRRQKLQRRDAKEAELLAKEKREKLHQNINAEMQKIVQRNLELKREKEMKEAADQTLSEVRKKNSEVEKSIQLLQGMIKLRKLRKDRVLQRGLHPPEESDQQFADTTSQLLELMKKQKQIYEGEQKTLEVMLETEQEETKEKEREIAKLKEEGRRRKQEKKRLERLFGKDDTLQIDHPLYPYRQYYEQGNQSLQALVQIRSDWDRFLVPEHIPGGSQIPSTWVEPTEPSNDTWATAVKET